MRLPSPCGVLLFPSGGPLFQRAPLRLELQQQAALPRMLDIDWSAAPHAARHAGQHVALIQGRLVGVGGFCGGTMMTGTRRLPARLPEQGLGPGPCA